MRRAALAALLSHWRAHPVQLAMLVLGLALATALWSGVQAINAEARASYAQAAGLLGQDRLDRLVPADGGAQMDERSFVALRRAGWRVAPVLEGRTSLGDARVTLLGIDPLTNPAQAGTDRVLGEIAAAGLADFMTPPGLFLAAPGTAAELAGVAVRAVEGLPEGTVLADIGIAQRLLQAEGRISRLVLAPDQPAWLPPWNEVLDAAGLPQLVLQRPEGASDLERLTDSFHLNLTAFGFLAFAVGLFIVHSAVGLAFEQRRVIFRTLRALGLPGRTLVGLLLGELALLALVAGIAGIALGYLVAAALLPGVAATLGGLYGAAVPGSLQMRPDWALAGMAMALAGTLLAGLRSLWQVWRLPLLAPAQPRAWARASERALAGQGAAALALFALAGGLAVWGSGLVVGFVLLAALLLGAALLLPAALALVLRAAQALAARRRAGGRDSPLAEWFWADTRQQLPGLSLALMALMLALAANVGVGTMVSSFRMTFTGWLDQRLVAELYITARDEAEAERLRDWLAPRADAVLPVWRVQGTLGAEGAAEPAARGELYGIADHPTYRDHWPLLQGRPDLWDRLAAAEGVLINEQLARRDELRPGDPVRLPGGRVLPAIGVYSDYGNPAPQGIVGIELFLQDHPQAPRLAHAVRVAPGRASALAEAVMAEFDLPPDRVSDQQAAKDLSLRIFERTFAVTGALNLLTLGVAGLALLAGLVTLSGMRLPQLAPVWAMGLTRRRLALLETLRSALLAALTALVALPVGLMLAWVLLAVINVEAFGWRLPMFLFPTDWLRMAAIALVVAVLAAALPARRLARIAPADLLRVFATER